VKRLGALLAMVALVATGLPERGVGQTVDERPNILIITTDDQRAQGTYQVMPDTMRIFRDQGIEFPNAVATTPLCCPARASFMTGLYAHNTGVTTLANAKNIDQFTTIQYQLQSRGYKTAHIGKYMNGWTGRKPYFNYVGGRVGYYKSDGSYGTTVNKDAALQFLDNFEQTDATPWLMYVNIYAPHPPAQPENQYASAPVGTLALNPALTESDRSDKPPYVKAQSKGIQNTVRANQLRTLYSADDLVQAVYDRLAALGETNTLAFFLSDNGFMWGEHQLKEKRHPYNDSVRVPMFMRWPGHLPEGTTNPNIVALIDLAPTIYEATGIVPANYVPDGKPMLTSARDHILIEHFVEGGVPSWQGSWRPDESYIEYQADGFKEYYGPDDPWQLENLFANGVTGDEPANADELRARVQSDATCDGATCP